MNSFNFKVGVFALVSLLLGAAFTVYVLAARGFFEDSFRLQFAAPSADGVAVGTPLSFSGMDIGQVTAIALNDLGGIVIQAELPPKNARWLRETSTFVLDKPIVGGAKIRVDSPDLTALALKDNATVLLLTSDVTREIPVLVERVKGILANVEHLTRKDGEIVGTLANVETVTGRMTGEYGVLEGVFGSADKARALTDSVAETRALLVKINGIAARVDGTLAKTDAWLFDKDGVAEHTRESLVQVRAMLTDVSSTLKKADALMANAVEISGDVKQGTKDIARLRNEIDESVRRVNGLVNELNKKWPFARDVEVKLP
jgi:phospholipid/cholesterol/gamma-HCH transport system substrate-binding protein